MDYRTLKAPEGKTGQGEGKEGDEKKEGQEDEGEAEGEGETRNNGEKWREGGPKRAQHISPYNLGAPPKCKKGEADPQTQWTQTAIFSSVSWSESISEMSIRVPRSLDKTPCNHVFLKNKITFFSLTFPTRF